MAVALWALIFAVTLAACGGGGGGGGGAILSFSPSTVTTNVAAGTSATITVRATASDPALFDNVGYVYVVDSEHVLTSSVELAGIDAKTFSATVHTSPSLAEGHHQGTFQIQLCQDPSCTMQVQGSPVPLPYDLNVTPAPLHLTAGSSTAATAHHGGNPSDRVEVSVGGPSLAWTATTQASWLQITGGSGTGPGTFSVTYLTQDLAEGSYSTVVTVRSSDGQTSELPFTVDVLPTEFVLNSGVPSFSAVNGAPIAAKAVDFELNNGVPTPWTATVSANWLLANPLAGTTPGEILLQPDPTRGPLASGAYSADLVLSSLGTPSKTVQTQLTLSKPTLSAAASSVTLGGDKGRDLTVAQSLAVKLNTGTNSWPYTLSGLPAWLSVTGASASVNQNGTALSLTPKLGSITPGSASATVSVNATVNGDAVALPLTVNINADQRRLLASEWGVSLASSPTGTVLSHTVTISDNFSGSLSWTAVSDAPWLTVTGGGNTTGSTSLSLNADPSALPANTVSYAKVTVSTATSGVDPGIVRVALWKSATGLATITKLPLNYLTLVADKVRPYIYAHNGGTSIDVFNAYTATKIATIANVGSALGQMSVSPDGARLYALDAATRSMAVVDLATRAKTATWTLVNAVSTGTSVLAIRPNGAEVVLVGDGTGYKDGHSLGSTGMFGQLQGSADGRSVFNESARYSVDYSAMSGGVLFASATVYLDGRSGGNFQDVAIRKDGTHVYQASGGGVQSGGYHCASIDGVTGAYIGALPGADAYPNNVEVTTDGRVICGISGLYSDADFWVYSPDSALLSSYKFAGYARSMTGQQMVVTPDGLIVVALTDDPLIAFVPIGR